MITNELLLQKIKEQIHEAEQLANEPILFKETLKRVELLCELVTEDDSNQQAFTKVTPEMLDSSNQGLKHSLESMNEPKKSDSLSDSIFDF